VATGWRIVGASHSAQAFDGEGARLNGGRWNSPGVRMVYTAESPALATLELLVQSGTAAPFPHFVLIAATFPDGAITRLDPDHLPVGWQAYPAPPELQQIGDSWIKAAGSVVLQVPSAVLPMQYNFLLNPLHRSFGTVKLEAPQPFELDLRLLPKP
jgi:RES domain-containing protein